MAKVRVLYFAAVRDALGISDEWLDLPATVRCVSDLSRHVARLHPELSSRLESVRFAVNETFADDETPVTDGDVVALIPPVSGG